MAKNDRGLPEEPRLAAPAIGHPSSVSRFVLVRLPHIICGVLLLAAIAINFANVVGRYIFSAPVAWAEEILIYMIVWGVFISVGSITYQGLHLRMDLLVIRISGWAKTFLGALTATLIIICSIFVAVQTTRILGLYIGSSETSMGAKIPLFIPHSALLVGFIMMAIAAAIRFRNYVTGKFD